MMWKDSYQVSSLSWIEVYVVKQLSGNEIFSYSKITAENNDYRSKIAKCVGQLFCFDLDKKCCPLWHRNRILYSSTIFIPLTNISWIELLILPHPLFTQLHFTLLYFTLLYFTLLYFTSHYCNLIKSCRIRLLYLILPYLTLHHIKFHFFFFLYIY